MLNAVRSQVGNPNKRVTCLLFRHIKSLVGRDRKLLPMVGETKMTQLLNHVRRSGRQMESLSLRVSRVRTLIAGLEAMESRTLLSTTLASHQSIDSAPSVIVADVVAVDTAVAVLGTTYPSSAVYVGATFWQEMYGYVENGTYTQPKVPSNLFFKELSFAGQTINEEVGSQTFNVAKLTAPTTPGQYTISYRVQGEGTFVDVTDWSDPVTRVIDVLPLPKGSIDGNKYNDLNANGKRDAGEPGLAGWTMYLDLNSSGARDAGEPSALTDSQGHYSFTGLNAGIYTVAEVAPAGWQQTSAARQILSLADFNDAGGNPSLDGFTTQALFSSESGPDWGTVSTFSSDPGHSSLYSAGPDGAGVVPGILKSPTIDLRGTTSAWLTFNSRLLLDYEYDPSWVGRKLWDNTSVGVDGGATGVLFGDAGLNDAAGVWTGSRVDISQYAGASASVQFTYDSQYANAGRDDIGFYVDDVAIEAVTSTIGASTVSVGAGVVTDGLDSGSRQVAVPGRILGEVRQDSNANGLKDSGEYVVAQVAVELFTPGGDSVAGTPDDVSLGVAITNGAGRFDFPSVPAGQYYLTIHTPTGRTLSPMHRGTDINRDSDGDPTTGSTDLFTVVSGVTQRSVNFGVVGSEQAFGAAMAIGSVGNERANAVATDAAGNVFVAGSFEQTIDFDNGPALVSLTSAGLADGFIAKYTPAGSLIWVRSLGGLGNDAVKSLRVTSEGIFVAGDFSLTADLDPSVESIHTATSQGLTDIFVSKLDLAGKLVWTHTVGGSNIDFVASLSVNANGDVALAGTFRDVSVFDAGLGPAVVSAGGEDAFVARINPSGQVTYFGSIGGAGDDEGGGVVLTANGALYVTGSFQGAADLNPGTGIDRRISAGSSDVFLIKLLPDNSMLWARTAGGGGTDRGSDVSIDKSGNVFVAGAFSSVSTFGQGVGTTTLSSAGGTDAFVWKLSSLGKNTWVRGWGGTLNDAAVALTINEYGEAQTTGTFEGTIVASPSQGYFTATSAGGSDVFIDSLSAAGSVVYLRTLGGASDDVATAIAAAGRGELVLAGYAVGQTNLAPRPGAASYVPNYGGGYDGFAMKLRAPASVGDRVWLDINANGVQDIGEHGLAGVTLRLFDAVDGVIGNGNDVQVGVDIITNADGTYRFAGLTQGRYYLSLVTPGGMSVSPIGRGTPSTDNNVNPSTGSTGLLVLKDQGPAEKSVDVGLFTTATLSTLRKLTAVTG